MKKPELLSPAGNMDALKAAINGGCDAVYLGGKLFGARAFSNNFSDDEIIEAIKYAHIYGVKVYVTVNTIIYENEVDAFMKYIDFLYKNNVDALIIQDLGMMDLIRKTYPKLELHASTQMNIHNIEGAKLLEELGIKRVVLAREVSIDKIKEIKKNTNIEIEAFIHGALCISYSGQCLMSSLLNGRSGNRGTCSQCCRMRYNLISNNKKINSNDYLLSTKDLNTLKYIPELIESGIDSFKIEGRMKRAEYVYLITKIYRTAIDNYFNKKDIYNDNDILEMKKIFNREFTKGFIFNEENDKFINSKRPNHVGIKVGEVIGKNKIKLTDKLIQGDGIRIIGKKDTGLILNKIYKNGLLVNKGLKGDIITIDSKESFDNGIVVKTSDKEQLDNLNQEMKNNKKIAVELSIETNNDTLILELSDYKNKVIVKENIVEKALKGGTSKERIIEQLTKFGETPFRVCKINSNIDDNIFINIKALNEVRRSLINMLIDKRCYQNDYIKSEYNIDMPNYSKEEKYSYQITTLDNYNLIKEKDIEDIYIEEPLYDNINDSRKVKRINRVNFDLKEDNNRLLISDVGSLAKYKNIVTDFNFNVVNSYTVAFLHSIGVDKVTLSYELKYAQIKRLIDNYHKRYNKHPNVEVIIDSIPEVMISKYNLLKDYNIKNGYLKDDFNNKYIVKEKNNIMTIYNYDKVLIKDNLFDIGVNSVRIHMY